MYKKAKVIRQIRELMEKGMRYSKACEQVVKSRATIEFWREKHPRLERYFQALMHKREEKIIDAVEDKLLERLLKGEATPTEYIFYLTNHRPEKWKNNYRFEHTGDALKFIVQIIKYNEPEREQNQNSDSKARFSASSVAVENSTEV